MGLIVSTPYVPLTILTATSSTKTPTASGNYNSMTGNSVSLTVGTWRLDQSTSYSNGGSNPAYSYVAGGIFGANGADTATTPTLLTSTANLTVNSTLPSLGGANNYQFIFSNLTAGTSDYTCQGPSLIVTVTATVIVYSVPIASMVTASNARIITYLTAQKLY